MELQSAQSMRVSLESIRRGEGGLDAHRTIMLQRVPEPGDWAKFPPEHCGSVRAGNRVFTGRI